VPSVYIPRPAPAGHGPGDLIRIWRESGRYRADELPSYFQVWKAIAEGRIPSFRDGNRRRVLEEHVNLAAEVLGLEPARMPTPLTRPKPRPRPAAPELPPAA
jgi:hypothetical protein